VHEQLRLGAAAEEAKVVVSGRSGERDDALHALVAAAETHADRCAEREAGDDHLARLLLVLEQEVECRARVVGLALAVVVRAGAVADAAEVDAQGLEAGFVQRARTVEHDRVVHRAAVEGVRVQDESDPLGGFRRRTVDRLEVAVVGGDLGFAGEHAIRLHGGPGQ